MVKVVLIVQVIGTVALFAAIGVAFVMGILILQIAMDTL